jgi:uncharacterized protein YecT (DUF1311 family)
MITSQEVQNRLIDSTGYENDLEIIDKALNEAWNEAIEAAVETMDNQDTLKLAQESILKLKK